MVAFNLKVMIALWALLASGCSAAPGPTSTLTLSYDGLVPVRRDGPTRVWIKEGFPLAGYRKIMLDRVEVRYRPLPWPPGSRTATEKGLDAARKAELRAMIREEFGAALEALQLEQVSEPDAGVLKVRGAILDVVTRPDRGRHDAGLDFIGQTTFMVELVDAPSESVLARAVDTRAASRPGSARAAATQEDGTRALLSRWAALLVDALNDLTAIDQYQENHTDA